MTDLIKTLNMIIHTDIKGKDTLKHFNFMLCTNMVSKKMHRFFHDSIL